MGSRAGIWLKGYKGTGRVRESSLARSKPQVILYLITLKNNALGIYVGRISIDQKVKNPYCFIYYYGTWSFCKSKVHSCFCYFLWVKSSIPIHLMGIETFCAPKCRVEGIKMRMEKYFSNNLIINHASGWFIILLWKLWTSPKWITICHTHHIFLFPFLAQT